MRLGLYLQSMSRVSNFFISEIITFGNLLVKVAKRKGCKEAGCGFSVELIISKRNLCRCLAFQSGKRQTYMSARIHLEGALERKPVLLEIDASFAF